MSLHRKTHRMLLVLGFVYLTTCPLSGEITKHSFDYSALGRRIERVEQQARKTPFFFAACRAMEPASLKFSKAAELPAIVSDARLTSENTLPALLSSVKLLL